MLSFKIMDITKNNFAKLMATADQMADALPALNEESRKNNGAVDIVDFAIRHDLDPDLFFYYMRGVAAGNQQCHK